MAIATKRLLADALKKLLETRTLDKITVKELVQSCGVNRQTFYYNFQDIYDLMDWIFQEDEKRILGEKIASGSWKELLTDVFEYMQDDRNRNLVQNACNSMSRRTLNSYLKRWIRPAIAKYVDSQAEDLVISDENRNFVIDAFVVMMVGIIFEWLDGDMQKDRRHQIGQIVRLVDGSVRNALEKMADDTAGSPS